MDKFNCPNKSNHISAFPGYGRSPCPLCHEVYVKSIDRLVEESVEKSEERRKQCQC